MADIGGLIGSVAKPFLELLAGAAVGGSQATSPQGVDMREFNRVIEAGNERKRSRERLQQVGRLVGMPEEKVQQLPEGLDPAAIVPQYQLTGGGQVAELPGLGQPPRHIEIEGGDFALKPHPSAPRIPGPGARGMYVDGQWTPIPEGMQTPRKEPGSGRPDHYDDRQVNQREGHLGILFGQRRNLMAGALTPSDRGERAKMLPPIDDQIAAEIEELPPAKQAKWKKLFASAQKATPAPKAPDAAPAPAATPKPSGAQSWTDWAKSYMPGASTGPAAAPTPQAAPAPTAQARIRVRQKATGQTGTIPAAEFDPAVYDRVQ